MWWLAACQLHAPTELEGRYEVLEWNTYQAPGRGSGALLEMEDPTGRTWPVQESAEEAGFLEAFELVAEGPVLRMHNVCPLCDGEDYAEFAGRIRDPLHAEAMLFGGAAYEIATGTCTPEVRWSVLDLDPETDQVTLRSWALHRSEHVRSSQRACLEDEALAEEVWSEDRARGRLLERWTVERLSEIIGQR